VRIHGRRRHHCSGHLLSRNAFHWRSVSDIRGHRFCIAKQWWRHAYDYKEWRVHIPTLVPSRAYKLRFWQPSGPNQTCTVSLGTGTASANVTNVSVVCPLSSIPSTSASSESWRQRRHAVAGQWRRQSYDAKKWRLRFCHAIAHGSPYDVNVFVAPAHKGRLHPLGLERHRALDSGESIPLVDCGHTIDVDGWHQCGR